MNPTNLETENATIEDGYLVRVQIPANSVSTVLESITQVSPLRYGNYEQVAFRYNAGTLQFKPLEGSQDGDIDLVQVACDEISFNLPKDETKLRAVIDAIYGSHPYEEPVIQIQEVLSTRFKYTETGDNPNKWWNRPEEDWESSG